MTDIAQNLARVMEQIHAAARQAGRDPAGVQLVAVTKTKPPEMIRAAIDAGARIVGENYLQEAQAKVGALGRAVSWHLVGRLQRNKARKAVEIFDVIQTLDSAPLAQTLDRLGQERGRLVRILVEVNIGGEASKGGVPPGALPGFLAGLAPYEAIRVEGLMTVPPPQKDAAGARASFRLLRALRDEVRQGTPANVDLRELSMGMSDDFTVAIAEGATIVRVGRAIFGARPSK